MKARKEAASWVNRWLLAFAAAAALGAQPANTGTILAGAYVGTGGAIATSGAAGTLSGSLTDQDFDGGGGNGTTNSCVTTQPGWSCAYTDAKMPAAFPTLRFGPSLHYRIPVPAGYYQGTLTFVEPNRTAAGQRLEVWSVMGQSSAPLDVFASAGGADVVLTVPWVALVGSGLLDIQITGQAGSYAVLSAISWKPAQIFPWIVVLTETPGAPAATLPGGIPAYSLVLTPGPGIIDMNSQTADGLMTLDQSVDTAFIPTRIALQAGQDTLCRSASASSKTYTCSLLAPPALGGAVLRSYTPGMRLAWVPDVTPEAGATLNVDLLGAVPLVSADGMSSPPKAFEGAAALVAGHLYEIWYDGVSFRLL